MTIVEAKWEEACGRVLRVVVSKLHHGEKYIPILLDVGDAGA